MTDGCQTGSFGSDRLASLATEFYPATTATTAKIRDQDNDRREKQDDSDGDFDDLCLVHVWASVRCDDRE